MALGKSPPLEYKLTSPTGLSIEILSNGSLKRIMYDHIMINLFPGNCMEGGLNQIYIRIYADQLYIFPLLGPKSDSKISFSSNIYSIYGELNRENQFAIQYVLTLSLSNSIPTWQWTGEVYNVGDVPTEFDLIYVNDLGLSDYDTIQQNQYFVSQYIHHEPRYDSNRGYFIISRQNQSLNGKNPATLIFSMTKSTGYSTDSLQLVGEPFRIENDSKGLKKNLPNRRVQHEHSMIALQTERMNVTHADTKSFGFIGKYFPSINTDYAKMEIPTYERQHTFSWNPFSISGIEDSKLKWHRPIKSLFVTSKTFYSIELNIDQIQKLFPNSWRHKEVDSEKHLLSFYTDDQTHVVTKRKEQITLRPHGGILSAGQTLFPEKKALTSTYWMNGIFISMLTQGHVSMNRFLSTVPSYLGLFRSYGLRLFVEIEGQWLLLDMPSLFSMDLNEVHWFYFMEGHELKISVRVSSVPNQIELVMKVLAGPPLKTLASFHIALAGDNGAIQKESNYEVNGNSILVYSPEDSLLRKLYHSLAFSIDLEKNVSWEKISNDALLFENQISQNESYITGVISSTDEFCLRLSGELKSDSESNEIETNISKQKGIRSLELPSLSNSLFQDTLPWFLQNALTHYLSPRGLEQFTGGGYGTRDVCQGPFELLFAFGKWNELKEIILLQFAQQSLDGDFPQWYMFFEEYKEIRAQDSHGDIVYWPVIALADYIIASNDLEILNLNIFYSSRDKELETESESIHQHVIRALLLMEEREKYSTTLVMLGNGDWNDSMQPVTEDFRNNAFSSWMMVLYIETISKWIKVLELLNDQKSLNNFKSKISRMKQDFRKYFIKDQVIAGLVYWNGRDPMLHYLHPSDHLTSISYSLLPIMHALKNDLFETDEATRQLEIIFDKLMNIDGVRLFDVPVQYNDGKKTSFERSETATFFGREIGLMYTHAHLRFCEVLAHFGKAQEFYNSLLLVLPIGLRERVASSSLRQTNCYYSSSDAYFSDRYVASDEYNLIKVGKVMLEGGWRIYSSGAGIFIKLILSKFLGISILEKEISFDPVMPCSLNGFFVHWKLDEIPIQIRYSIVKQGAGVVSIQVNGQTLDGRRDQNIHRVGAFVVNKTFLLSLLHSDDNIIEISIL